MRGFSKIAFTPAVKAAQERMGSRSAYARLERAPDVSDALGEDEVSFLAERDSFYMASIGESGWPYIQHRGGPKGFVRVLDERTIAFADLRGNRQYISTGNVAGDDRVALIFVDYPNRARLKVLARARMVTRADDPETFARVAGDAAAERVFVLRLEGLDWNCPQYITPRFTEDEVRARSRPLVHKLEALERENAALRAHARRSPNPIGSHRRNHMSLCKFAAVDGNKIFYREAGDDSAPGILLLHGFPSSSHMFRDLIPKLSDRFRVVAPDLPGFGFTEPVAGFEYAFDALARTIQRFTDEVGLGSYVLYVFDYGAPVGFRLAMARPDRVRGIVTQNGNAYEEGLSNGWSPFRAYWSQPTRENRDALRSLLNVDTTRWQYTHGTPEGTVIAPEAYLLDQLLLDRPGNAEIQLDLFRDYRTNVALYPKFHEYFRTHQPKLLAVWGRNDPYFLPAGAEAFKRDLPDARVRLFDTGHFALETHAQEISNEIRSFFAAER